MKKFKFLFLATAALFSASVSAQTLSMDPIALGAGQEATVQVKLSGSTDASSIQFTLMLPEGVRQVDVTSDANTQILTVNPNAITWNSNRTSAPSTKSLNYVKKTKKLNGKFIFDNEIGGTDGEWVMSFKVKNFSAATQTVDATFQDVMVGPAGSAVSIANTTAEVTTSDQDVYMAVIASSGWSTICSAKGLDLSSVEAYIVSDVTATSATLTKVTEAAGGEGILVKAEGGKTISIPYKDGATTAGTNKLVGVTETTSIAGDGTIFFLSDGKFVKAAAKSTLFAGHAYLAGVPASAKVIDIVLDDPTAIKSVEAEQNNGVLYNLNGVRVDNPTKGVYIQNGRKVVVK